MTEAQRITAALQGRWHGRYGLARCPAHGDRNPSLSLSDGP
ncbi:virulence-associated protein E, partial [Haematobacter massiliensis]